MIRHLCNDFSVLTHEKPTWPIASYKCQRLLMSFWNRIRFLNADQNNSNSLRVQYIYAQFGLLNNRIQIHPNFAVCLHIFVFIWLINGLTIIIFSTNTSSLNNFNSIFDEHFYQNIRMMILLLPAWFMIGIWNLWILNIIRIIIKY